MSLLQKKKRSWNWRTKEEQKVPHCACRSVSAAPLTTSPTSTLGCWAICEHPKPTVCLRGDQVPIQSNWFRLAFVFPSYRRIHSGKLENSNCPLVRTSTTQRRLRRTDLYQPLKLFLGLIWSWGVKLEGGFSACQIFLLSLTLTEHCWPVAETCSANECTGCFHMTGILFLFCCKLYILEKAKCNITAQLAASLNVTSTILKGSCFQVLTPAQLRCSNLAKTSCCSRVKKKTGAGFNQPWRLSRATTSCTT